MTPVVQVLRRARTALVYVLLLHVVRVLSDALLPNTYLTNRIRGKLLSPFFAACGRRFAIASDCVINSPWALHIGDDVYIAHRSWINAAAGLTIGDSVIISPNVVIATTAHDRVGGKVSLRRSRQAPVSIGAGTWIASNTVVTKGSTIGEGVVIGAGSVVIGDVPDNCLFAGNPGKVLRSLPSGIELPK